MSITSCIRIQYRGVERFSVKFSVIDRNLIRKFIIVLDEVYFKLSRNVNIHSIRYWCSENPRDVCEVPLRNLIAGG